MGADVEEHIQVSEELAELGGCFGAWGDALNLALKPDKKKVGEESRAMNEGLAWACCGMRGWRETMEDASLVMPPGYLGGHWRRSALFGVFDGHGGEQVARFAARQLPIVLAENPSKDADVALTQSYARLDELLRLPTAAAELRDLTIPGNEIRDSAEGCGCTAVCCLIEGSQLVVANAGDSRAVLCRQGKAIALSEDHKPELPRETARIEAADGFVQQETLAKGGFGYRVNGNLNLSRALGDLRYKDPDVPIEKQVISGVPDIRQETWQLGRDEFVILACDGVWECMTAQQVVNFVRPRLPPPGKKVGLLPVLEALLDACCANHPMQRGGDGCDNITAVIVRFEDPSAVAAAGDEPDIDEVVEENVSNEQKRRLEAAVGQSIQRLSDRRFRKAETLEEKAEREANAKAEWEEEVRRAQEAIKQQELRKKRREERELQESKSKKRLRCCAAVESDDEESGDE